MALRNVWVTSTVPSLLRAIAAPIPANASGVVAAVLFILPIVDSRALTPIPRSPATSCRPGRFLGGHAERVGQLAGTQRGSWKSPIAFAPNAAIAVPAPSGGGGGRLVDRNSPTPDAPVLQLGDRPVSVVDVGLRTA